MRLIILSIIGIGLINQLFASSILRDGKEILPQHPLGVENRAKEYGGMKNIVDAYQDGVGVYVGAVKQDKKIDQTNLIELVNKYGEVAKTKGVTITEEVMYGENIASNDQVKASKVFSMIPNGTACNDNNPDTYNDTFATGICKGEYAGSCLEVQKFNAGAITGTYKISPAGIEPFNAYCDMDTAGGGWTLIANNLSLVGPALIEEVTATDKNKALTDAKWQALLIEATDAGALRVNHPTINNGAS